MRTRRVGDKKRRKKKGARAEGEGLGGVCD